MGSVRRLEDTHSSRPEIELLDIDEPRLLQPRAKERLALESACSSAWRARACCSAGDHDLARAHRHQDLASLKATPEAVAKARGHDSLRRPLAGLPGGFSGHPAAFAWHAARADGTPVLLRCMRYDRTVIAYHGCDVDVADAVRGPS